MGVDVQTIEGIDAFIVTSVTSAPLRGAPAGETKGSDARRLSPFHPSVGAQGCM